MMEKNIRVASVQFCHRASDKPYNLSIMEHFIAKAHKENVQILAFPEMCITGYWHVPDLSSQEVNTLAERADSSQSLEKVASVAKRYHMAIGAGFIEKGAGGKLYNSYAVCMPDGKRHIHRKLHAFEHPDIARGNDFTVFDTPWGVRIGILICWDNNLVENARITALMGADILIAPHQTGGTNSRSPFGMKPIPVNLWENRHEDPNALKSAFQGDSGRGWIMRWLPSRAHDNGFFILFSNGVGLDNGEVRTGNSMILDPYGRVVNETDSFEDAIVFANLDLELLAMSTGRRWIHGRRPELYKILSESQSYERDARTARFSADIPSFGCVFFKAQKVPSMDNKFISQNSQLITGCLKNSLSGCSSMETCLRPPGMANIWSVDGFLLLLLSVRSCGGQGVPEERQRYCPDPLGAGGD